jgi:hypothetical protein
VDVEGIDQSLKYDPKEVANWEQTKKEEAEEKQRKEFWDKEGADFEAFKASPGGKQHQKMLDALIASGANICIETIDGVSSDDPRRNGYPKVTVKEKYGSSVLW